MSTTVFTMQTNGQPIPVARPQSARGLYIAPPPGLGPGLGPAPSAPPSRTHSSLGTYATAPALQAPTSPSPKPLPSPEPEHEPEPEPEETKVSASSKGDAGTPAWVREEFETVATNERYAIRVPCSKDNPLLFNEDTYAHLAFEVDAKLHVDFIKCFWDACSWRGDGENCRVIKPKHPDLPSTASHFPDVVRRMGGPENPLVFTERIFVMVDIDMGDVHAVFEKCTFLYCNFDGWSNCVERGCTKVSPKKGYVCPHGLRRTPYAFSVVAVNSTGDAKLRLWGTISHTVTPVDSWKDAATFEKEKDKPLRRLSRRLSAKWSQLFTE